MPQVMPWRRFCSGRGRPDMRSMVPENDHLLALAHGLGRVSTQVLLLLFDKDNYLNVSAFAVRAPTCSLDHAREHLSLGSSLAAT